MTKGNVSVGIHSAIDVNTLHPTGEMRHPVKTLHKIIVSAFDDEG